MNQYRHRPVYQEMLGDLPLIRRDHWSALGREYWDERGCISYQVGLDLEHLQRALYKEQQRSDTEVDLNAKHTVRNYPWPSYTRNNKTPFHPDILRHWEAFVVSQKDRTGLTRFSVDKIVLPPSSFFAEKIMPILTSSSNTLTCLQLSCCDLSSNVVGSIARFLAGNSTVSILDLSKNIIDDVSAAESLAVAMNNHPLLCMANFSRCGLGRNIEVLTHILDGMPNMKTVLLERNEIKSTEGVKLVANFIENNATVTVMSLEGNAIGNENMKLVGKALKRNTQLCQIGLGYNNISLPSFIRSKSATEHLTHLDLSTYRWNLDPCTRQLCTTKLPGAKLIAEYIESNPALTELNLEGNRIPAKAIKLIASAMKQNTNLEHLNLSNNSVTDNCVPALVDMLKNNTTLRSLNVIYNEGLRYKTGRKQLIHDAICDSSSLACIAESNHTCIIQLSGSGRYMNGVTHEMEMRNINSLDNEGSKIRYKVVLALFVLNTELFDPRNFNDVPLELMPRLLEMVQQEIGYNGFGEGMPDMKIKKRKSGNELRRIYEVMQGWPALPLLFMVSIYGCFSFCN